MYLEKAKAIMMDMLMKLSEVPDTAKPFEKKAGLNASCFKGRSLSVIFL